VGITASIARRRIRRRSRRRRRLTRGLIIGIRGRMRRPVFIRFCRTPMLASSMCARVLVSSTSRLARLALLLPTLRIHLQVLYHLRSESAVCCYPVAWLALVLSGAGARPDERIWAQIALDVGRDYFSRDTVAGHEPLICARHGYREVCGETVRERRGLSQCQKTGPSYGS